MERYDSWHNHPLFLPLASLVCGVSWKVLFSAMVMDFGHCGISTALSFNIADSLYNLSLSHTQKINLNLTLRAIIKKLNTTDYWANAAIFPIIYVFFLCIVHIGLWSHVLLIYNPHLLIYQHSIVMLWLWCDQSVCDCLMRLIQSELHLN